MSLHTCRSEHLESVTRAPHLPPEPPSSPGRGCAYPVNPVLYSKEMIIILSIIFLSSSQASGTGRFAAWLSLLWDIGYRRCPIPLGYCRKLGGCVIDCLASDCQISAQPLRITVGLLLWTSFPSRDSYVHLFTYRRMSQMQEEIWELSDGACYVALTNEPLAVQPVMDRVRSPQAGAIVLFAGSEPVIASRLGPLTRVSQAPQETTSMASSSRSCNTRPTTSLPFARCSPSARPCLPSTHSRA